MNKQQAKEKIETLVKEIESRTKEIEELEAIVNAPEEALRLEHDDDDCISIKYGEELIGYINEEGACYILSAQEWVETYNQWRKDGMKTDSTVVEWRGKKYMITKNFDLQCIDATDGMIYDFAYCQYVAHCNDDNIIRFEHNLKPIGF